jgi:penicillin-binding protein 2
MGQSLNAVIGQGSTRVTLLQMVTLYAAIANGGKLWLPQIVDRIESPDQKVLEEFAPRVRRELSVSPENLALIRQGLVGVVNEPKGTAFRVRTKDVEVAGKTGTAQVRRSARRGEAISSYDQNDHAWFVGFAPAGNPKIAFAVLIEHGGHGGEVAAPAAMEIVHNYFETVAPEQKNAPHVGLPRRRLFHKDDDERTSADAAAASGGGASLRRRRPRVAADSASAESEPTGAGATAATTTTTAPDSVGEP